MSDKKIFLTEAESLEIVNFTNIGDFDFECGWGGHKELIPAGKTVPLPMFKAIAFCKHLVDAILRKEGKDYGSDLFRKPLEDRIMGRVKLEPTSLLKEFPKESPKPAEKEVPEETLETPEDEKEEFAEIEKLDEVAEVKPEKTKKGKKA